MKNETEFELGGERAVSFESYLAGLRKRYSLEPGLVLPIPGLLARVGAHLCDMVHFSPFSFGHWELLCYDNIPRSNQLKQVLGRAPVQVV